eukprot:gnl/MRDRNA2_/MRDRNA2_81588_c0_seq5.p1 gnl/MRDRNA2_/MRDRNA2_81588_c0~~gnl/MRDRNA2_/MRDRNA2_81588_c0_seq5.p1  ORF type:complete len:132 (-),score=1.27 gnl/MRDRNA2_/MRDRNA2_81588_c0_seq5:151-546(-)
MPKLLSHCGQPPRPKHLLPRRACDVLASAGPLREASNSLLGLQARPLTGTPKCRSESLGIHLAHHHERCIATLTLMFDGLTLMLDALIKGLKHRHARGASMVPRNLYQYTLDAIAPYLKSITPHLSRHLPI